MERIVLVGVLFAAASLVGACSSEGEAQLVGETDPVRSAAASAEVADCTGLPVESVEIWIDIDNRFQGHQVVLPENGRRLDRDRLAGCIAALDVIHPDRGPFPTGPGLAGRDS